MRYLLSLHTGPDSPDSILASAWRGPASKVGVGASLKRVDFCSVFSGLMSSSGRSRHASRDNALLVLPGSASAEIQSKICESLSDHDSLPERNGNLVSGLSATQQAGRSQSDGAECARSSAFCVESCLF